MEFNLVQFFSGNLFPFYFFQTRQVQPITGPIILTLIDTTILYTTFFFMFIKIVRLYNKAFHGSTSILRAPQFYCNIFSLSHKMKNQFT